MSVRQLVPLVTFPPLPLPHVFEQHTVQPVRAVDEFAKLGLLSISNDGLAVLTTDISSSIIYISTEASTPNMSSGLVFVAV